MKQASKLSLTSLASQRGNLVVNRRFKWLAVILTCSLGAACSPRVEITPSDKPITINLNVKIEHEVKVKIDKQLEEEVFAGDKKLF